MRRLLPIATAAVSLALIGAGGAVTARAMGRASSFHHDVATLERSWTQDVHEGVPASSIAHYYSPESAQYAMEFLRGGFFIHDAPWEPSSAFGPGSQNGVDASHGCVHLPTPTMAWLYAWSPIGTTVIIHG